MTLLHQILLKQTSADQLAPAGCRRAHGAHQLGRAAVPPEPGCGKAQGCQGCIAAQATAPLHGAPEVCLCDSGHHTL